jgi:4-hydroxybenzoyl-CoA thioesterase
VFEFVVTVAWGDCDEAGIVFYPNYYYWMDSAFQALLRQRSLSQRIIRGRFGAVGTPIVESGAKFLSPLRYDDTLSVRTAIAEWNERSFRIEFRGSADGTAVFEGYEVRVWAVAGATGGMRAAPIPTVFRNMMS